MLKKLLKLAHLVQAARHGHAHGGYKPWKGKKKWKRHTYGQWGGPYGHHPGYGPPPGWGHDPGPGWGQPYGYGHPYGHGRPRGLKGLILEAVLRRLLGRR